MRGPLRRAGLVGLGGAIAAVVILSPVKLCFMALALHIPCPGCGMTRATLALLRGEVAHAFALHPLSPLLAPFAACLIAAQTLAYVRTGAAFGTGRVPRWIELAAAVFAILLVAVWSARFLGYFGGPVSLR
jgi:Protein of unknown function (DUF2752)